MKAILAIMYLVAVIVGLLDCMENQKGKAKVLWILAILLVPYLGTIVYFVVGKK